MFSSKCKLFLTRVLIPAAAVVSEANDKKCKASELPIYTAEKKPEKHSSKKHAVVEPEPEPSIIEEALGAMRKQLFGFYNDAISYKEDAEEYLDGAVSQGKWLINYLGEENNTTPKVGAIAIGGLTGLILGLRGGMFRKFVFTSAGALTMASICYPNQAAEYGHNGLAEAKKYAIIGYNFVNGVKKGDPPLELPSLPSAPKTSAELWAIVVAAGQSASDLVLSGNEKKDDKK